MVKHKLNIGLFFLFIVLLVCLNHPLISLPRGSVASVPALLIYIVIVWISLIFTMRLVFFRKSGERKE